MNLKITKYITIAKKTPILGSSGRFLVANFRNWLKQQRWRIGVLIPVLINTTGDWDAYVNGLSKPAKKNLKAAKKVNSDVIFNSIPYSKDIVAEFMDIWGKYNDFPPDYIKRLDNLAEKNWLVCFAGTAGGGQ